MGCIGRRWYLLNILIFKIFFYVTNPQNRKISPPNCDDCTFSGNYALYGADKATGKTYWYFGLVIYIRSLFAAPWQIEFEEESGGIIANGESNHFSINIYL